MPWKEANVMDIRTEFLLKSLSDNQSFTELRKEYDIKDLTDKSRRPNSSSTRLHEDAICHLIRLKMAHRNWGLPK